MVYIKAKVAAPNVGDNEKGSMIIRSGGSRAWRCNNPGNLHSSPYSTSKDRRSIGTAGDEIDTYAVYPDYETGHEALIVMLKGSKYYHLTLREAMKRYDKNNRNYINLIVDITGFDPDRTVNSLNAQEFEMFWKAIERVEKWIKGHEVFVDKWYISGVHKKRGVITEYLIAKSTGPVWMEKEEAIKLAEDQRLHATLVHLKNGTVYLRPEYGQHRFEVIS